MLSKYYKISHIKVFFWFIFCTFTLINYSKALNVQHFKLYNGLEFYLIKNNNPVITYSTWVKIGGIDESSNKLGIAHFLEHMMFKDNKKYTAVNFTTALQRTGGSYNAFTNYNYTVYYNTIPANYLNLIMKLESNRLHGLLFKPEQFETEKKVILEERGLRIDNTPLGKYFEYINYHIFPFSNYGRSLIGSVTDINNITIKDLKEYYSKYYVPNNIKIFVIGNISFKSLKRLALKYYNNIPKSKYQIKEDNNLGEINYKYNTTISVKDKSVIQPIFGISYLAPILNRNNTFESILSLILLKQYLSEETYIFYKTLVKEKLLTSYISVSYNPLARLNTNFYILFMPKDNKKLLSLKYEANKLLNNIAINGINEQDLQTLYRQFLDNMIYTKNDNFTLLLFLAELIMSGYSIDEIQQLLSQLNKPLDYKLINSNITSFLRNNKMYVEINN